MPEHGRNRRDSRWRAVTTNLRYHRPQVVFIFGQRYWDVFLVQNPWGLEGEKCACKLSYSAVIAKKERPPNGAAFPRNLRPCGRADAFSGTDLRRGRDPGHGCGGPRLIDRHRITSFLLLRQGPQCMSAGARRQAGFVPARHKRPNAAPGADMAPAAPRIGRPHAGRTVRVLPPRSLMA